MADGIIKIGGSYVELAPLGGSLRPHHRQSYVLFNLISKAIVEGGVYVPPQQIYERLTLDKAMELSAALTKAILAARGVEP